MKKITPTHSTMRTIALPVLAVGILAGVAEAATSGVRVHRIGDPPMLPRNFVLPAQQDYVEAPAAPVAKPAPRTETPYTGSRTGRAVPLAPVGEEVGSAPVTALPAPAPAKTAGRVPLAPLSEAAQAPGYEPLTQPDPIRKSTLPLSPVLNLPAAATTQPTRARLPLAPVSQTTTPAAPAAAPQPVVAKPQAAAPVAPQPVMTKPQAAAPAPKPAAPAPAVRRRLPIAPVTDETNLPPLPATLVR